MLTNKCCGTCRFWREKPYGELGKCLAPVPEAVFDNCKDLTLESEGTLCEAWQEKRKDDEK